MTDTAHTADTEYHHDVPADLRINPPAAKKPDAPVPRAWPLAARLAVAVLIIGLAATTAGSLMALRRVSVTASQASQQASAEKGSVAALGRQLAAVQATVSVPPPKVRQPAIYQHYGICLVRTTDNATGDLANVTLASPAVTGGSYSCPQGTFVSVVPAP
jgi:hypothetical protein